MKAVRLTDTKVSHIDLGNTINCMIVEKGVCSNLVLQSHEFVLIVDSIITIDGEPFVKLAKVFNTPGAAYDKWLYLVGKMCRKKYTSKYFNNPKVSEHLKNGNVPDWVSDTVMYIAKTAVDIIKQELT